MKLHPRANFSLSILILLYIFLFNMSIGYAEDQNRADLHASTLYRVYRKFLPGASKRFGRRGSH